MAAVSSSSNLSELLEQLAEEKAQHEKGTAAIIETIEQISGLLGSLLGGRSTRPVAPSRPAPISHPKPQESIAVSAPPAAAKSGRGKRTKFAMNGEEAVLSFVRQHKNPSTSEIQAHWKSVGRASSADNSLSKLVKDKKLKREPNKTGRGSRYVLA
jgi:hypothetical protein